MRATILTYIILSAIGGATGAAHAAHAPRPSAHTTDIRPEAGLPVDQNTLTNNMTGNQGGDSTRTEVVSPPPRLFMWNISEKLGNQTIIPVDTAKLNYQNTNLVEGMTGHYNYLGNLGSPRMSRIFSERGEQEPTMFLEPFSSFIVRPGQMKFTNSNIPYTNLTYYKGGSKTNGEERFKAYFSVNANKRTAFGFNFDYLYGRGYYANQATAHFNANVFGSYIGERYQMHAIFNHSYLKMNENGGITDDQYITKPENLGSSSYTTSSIPVNMEAAANHNQDMYVYLTHRYRIGFKRKSYKLEDKKPGARPDNAMRPNEGEARKMPTEAAPALLPGQPNLPTPGAEGPAPEGREPRPAPAEMPADSLLTPQANAKDTITVEEFVPVTSIIHTVQVERTKHRFRDSSEATDAYTNTYYQTGSSNDSTTAFSVKNVLGIALLEGFNKYAKAGLTAYISHKYSRYQMMGDTLNAARRLYTEQEVFVGGELAKREGHTLHYKVDGEIGIMDKALGQFRVHADMDLNFRLWNDTVNLYARGYITNTLPTFYMRHYHSNHFAWDNDLSKEFRTRVEGELNIERWGTNLRAGVENIKNYTYFNASALPSQSGDNIQVIDATLKQNFRVGIFHLDNEVTWQKTSNSTVLPLPSLTLYHNFYLLAGLAKKVLTVQLGADVRYFTEYYAPAYTPAIQQFTLQDADNRVKLGGYPIVNVYANLHLKRTRLFAMMYHVNAGMGSRNYFLVPHHPLNQRLFKIGVSWNFFD